MGKGEKTVYVIPSPRLAVQPTTKQSFFPNFFSLAPIFHNPFFDLEGFAPSSILARAAVAGFEPY
jgi:hypothetical protein